MTRTAINTPRRRPLRLALVGLRYGLAYLPAIAAVPGVELVALGARGSRSSRRIAGELGLPLHTSAAALLEARPQAAIVAVPPDAVLDVACPLLAAGCHVLCEFPIDGTTAKTVARSARRGAARFHLNTHFSQLRAPTGFIRLCRKLGQPAVVQIVCHERTLFVCLDTIVQAFGEPFVPRKALVSGASGGVVLGTIGAATASIHVTPLLSDVDDGSDVFFGQRISAGYSGKTVTLLDSFGPVLASRANLLDLGTVIPATPARGMQSERIQANSDALRRFVRACRSRAPIDDAFIAVATSYTATVKRLTRRR